MTTKTIYIADDGTKFEKEDDCVKYENEYREVFEQLADFLYDYGKRVVWDDAQELARLLLKQYTIRPKTEEKPR